MKLVSALLLTAIAMPVVATAQTIDLGPDISGYTRFVVYPHLEKGLDSMERGDRDRAFSELERARSLAPDNAAVALYLAAAYRKFDENARAKTLLRDQLKRTPADARVKAALTEIEAALRPALVSAAPPPAATAVAAAAVKPTPVVTAPKRSIPRPAASARRTAAIPTPSDARTETEARFAAAVSEKRFADAEAAGRALLTLDTSPATLDEVSFRLVDAGADDEALSVLLSGYPFASAGAGQRDVLFQRMIPLVEHRRGELAEPRFQPLRAPLDTPGLRSRQGVLWTSVGDCEAVRIVLGDLSPEYGHDDWLRLGDCAATADPSLARSAYATAHAMQPGGRGSLALAYITFATGDYRASLDAWRTIGSHRLAPEQLLAASATALAAGEDAEAVTWLEAYRSGGGTLDGGYWSLLGRSRMRSDVPAAIDAFEHAVALRPEVNDLLRLAQLEKDPTKQVKWREAAATLVPTDAGVQADLGFAYLRAGRTADAVRALEKAFHADPSNMMVARQLVYSEQRLANNSSARRYAERVLDTPGAFTQGAGDLTSLQQADQRFGFQRLHEDLGRRLTVNLDGFSGTGVGARTASGQPGAGYRSYSQIEADVRLGREPIRNGRTVSAYARVFADGGELHAALPTDNAMLGAGLRWKPWRSQVIYLAAEAQHGLSDGSQHDALLRASASFLNGGRFGDDWHPARAGWFSQNLYLDAARYLQSDFNAFTADYRTSYHKRVADGSTLEPYAHFQSNFSGNSSLERDIRGGTGLRWNLWYGGSRYDADPHKLSFGIEFQQAFETYLPDRSSLFLTLGSRW